MTLPATCGWHVRPIFLQAPKASTYAGDKSFGGRALHRNPYIEKLQCGDATHPCSMVSYGGSGSQSSP